MHIVRMLYHTGRVLLQVREPTGPLSFEDAVLPDVFSDYSLDEFVPYLLKVQDLDAVAEIVDGAYNLRMTQHTSCCLMNS